MLKENCSLCFGELEEFYREEKREFGCCKNCGGIMLLPQFFLDPAAEADRYRLHNNDVLDERYQQFVSPITNAVENHFPVTSKGLDYGCGPGPVAAFQLKKAGYEVALYDPFFEDNPEALDQEYDFIICCEVMEHFYNPHKEFRLLKKLLKPGGRLYCKTSLYSKEKKFAEWYYKNDPTHVFLYTKESLEWIKGNFTFRNLEVQPDLIILEL